MEKKNLVQSCRGFPILEVADWPCSLLSKALGCRVEVGAETGLTGRGGHAGLCTTGT